MASRIRTGLLGAIVLSFTTIWASAQEPAPHPILRIDPGGHTSYVTSLAWTPDGNRLYSAGWDKVVRAWKRNDDGTLTAIPEETIRVPIAPGRSGQIDGLAVSADGRWMAICGYASLIANAAQFSEVGDERPLSAQELGEQGVIYLLDRTNQSFRRLVGHLGPVGRLQFAKGPNGAEQLISVGEDRESRESSVAKGSIRIWDVQSAKYINGILLEVPAFPPSIAVVPDSAAPSRIDLFAAWGNEKLFHYRYDAEGAITKRNEYSDWSFINQVFADSPSGTVWTCSVDESSNTGWLTRWNRTQAGLLERDAQRSIPFPKSGRERLDPMCCAVVSSQLNGPADHIAVLLFVRQQNADGGYEDRSVQLRVYRLADGVMAARKVVEQELWPIERGRSFLPELAYDANAQSLAIAGHPHHEIWLQDVPGLLRNEVRPQRTKSHVQLGSTVDFVQQQGRLGLRVLGKSNDEQRQIVFDLTESRIDKGNVLSWIPTKAEAAGWSTSIDNAVPNRLHIAGPNQKNSFVQVPRKHKITHAQFTSPTPERNGSPLLIVAANDGGQPWLGICDAESGDVLRILQVHTMPVNGLAISGDSRFLATSSDDSTFAIWNLSDLESLGQPRSTIPGLVLASERGPAKVESIQESAVPLPFKVGDFAKGDHLLGYVDLTRPGNTFQSWQSGEELYASLWALRARTRIAVRRQRGNHVADIPVTLQQAADVRKPLVQFVLTEPDARGHRQWIAWNMLGRFDSSDLAIQNRLGLQFNVSRPNSPVALATIDQYPEFYRPGLIAEALTGADQPLVVPPQPEPHMSIRVLQPEIDAWNQEGVDVVRSVPTAVSLHVGNDEFRSSLIQSLQLMSQGEPIGHFVRSGDTQWIADPLKLGPWTRGPHRLEVKLETRDQPSRTFIAEHLFEYIPPKPTIQIRRISSSSTREPKVSFSAQITAGEPSEPCDVSLVRLSEADDAQNAAERVTLRTWFMDNPDSPSLSIELDLELAEGKNTFLLEVRNRVATEATAELETASEQFDVVRLVRDTTPPVLEISSLRIDSPASPSDARILSPKPSDNPLANTEFVVSSQSVTLLGDIRGEEHLTTATVNGEPMEGFVAGNSKDFHFEIPLNLKPGRNDYQITAGTEGSDTTWKGLSIVFRQPVPEIELVKPYASQSIELLIPDGAIDYQAIFEPTGQTRPLHVVALLNGQRLENPPTIHLNTGTIEGTIPLAIGRNTLQLQTSNDTGSEGQSIPLVFYYHPSCEITQCSVPQEIEESGFAIQVEGRSASTIDRVLIDNRELSRAEWSSIQDGDRFVLDIPRVSWQASQAKSALAIYCQDVPQPTVQIFDLPKRKSPAMPPSIHFVGLANETLVNTETITLDYRVHSRHALTQVTLAQDGRITQQPKLPISAMDHDVHFSESLLVHLTPGVNTLQLTAENQDGVQTETLQLNYVPSPVSILLDSVTLLDDPGSPLPLMFHSDGSCELAAPVQSNRVRLTGRVKWNYRNESEVEDSRSTVWISVNGFKHPVPLSPPLARSSERTFESPVHLFGATRNSIEILLPELPQVSSSGVTLHIDCLSKETRKQRLHMVVIGVGVPRTESEALRDAAIASVAGTFDPQNIGARAFAFDSPAFSECIGYGPLTGDVVTTEKIRYVLDQVQRRANKSEGDVLMLYYRGGEQVYEGTRFYLTTQLARDEEVAKILRYTEQLRNRALSSDLLNEFVNYCAGCQLLLLDVVRTSPSVDNVAPANNVIPRAALFRYAWLNSNATAPDSARLISAWKSSRSAQRLGEVADQLGQQHETLEQELKDAISYEYFLPNALRDLVVRVELN